MPKKTLVRDRILAFIISYQDEHGFSPSMREIANGIGIASAGCVHKHISSLKEEGVLQETGSSTSRALVVNKSISSALLANHDQYEAIHICLKTDTGAHIVLTCIPQHDCLSFEGAFFIMGEHNRSGHVISCHKLSEADYDEIVERES